MIRTSELGEELIKAKKKFKIFLEQQYTFTKYEKWEITREDAINVNLSDTETINKVFFNNLPHLKRVAVYFEKKRSFGAKIFKAEDMINQFYIDLRYYNFTSEKIFLKCLYKTCATVNTGGILRKSESLRERKADVFLYDIIFKQKESGDELVNHIPDERFNPERILIEKETEKKDCGKILKSVSELLTPMQKKLFYKIYG